MILRIITAILVLYVLGVIASFFFFKIIPGLIILGLLVVLYFALQPKK